MGTRCQHQKDCKGCLVVKGIVKLIIVKYIKYFFLLNLLIVEILYLFFY